MSRESITALLFNCSIFILFRFNIQLLWKTAGQEVKFQFGGMARNQVGSYGMHLYIGFHYSFKKMLLTLSAL
jgi:hypothetical protein